MKSWLLSFSLLASPAWAVQYPTPLPNEPTICDINFSEDQAVGVPAIKGYDVEIRFSSNERVAQDGIASSNTKFIESAVPNGSANILHLRADLGGLPPQPIHVRTTLADGTQPRDYPLIFESFISDDDANKEPEIQTAAAGTPKPKKVNFCYVIRFHYPSDVKAESAARWLAKKRRDEADAAEIALHKAPEDRARNTHYVAQGDASIAPTEIYDDGYTTILKWPGNLSIPVILESRAKP